VLVRKKEISGVYIKQLSKQKRMELEEEYWKEEITKKLKRSTRKKRNPLM
jgi:hypothetical protein